MKNKIFAFIITIFLLLSSIAVAEVSHPAEQIKAGTFGAGDYKFPNKLGIGATPISELHVNGQLKIESGINDKIVLAGTQSSPHTIILDNSKGIRFWDSTQYNEIFKVTNSGDVSWLGILTSGSVPWSRITDYPGESDPEVGTVLSGAYCLGVDNKKVECTTDKLKETDPDVGEISHNYVPRWDGSLSFPSLVTGSIFDNGNIGIGTGTPIALFHVLTTGAIDATKQFYIERVADDTNGAGVVGRKARGTPTAKLTVKDKDVISGFLGQAYSASAGDYIWAGGIRLEVDGEPDTGGDPTDIPSRLVFYTVPDGSSSLLPRMTIKNNGNVGIGTTVPKTGLHVYAASGQPMTMIETGSKSDAAAARIVAPGGFGELGFGGSEYGFWGGANSFNIVHSSNGRAPAGPITFGHWWKPDKAREDMRITADGNVGIGTTNPEYRLDVFGGVKAHNLNLNTPHPGNPTIRLTGHGNAGQVAGDWSFAVDALGRFSSGALGIYRGSDDLNPVLIIDGNGLTRTLGGLVIEVRGPGTGKSCNPSSPSTGQMWLAASGCT